MADSRDSESIWNRHSLHAVQLISDDLFAFTQWPNLYLIDEKIRENFDIRYENSIIIFDEAHNVAQCAEDVTSFELKSKLLEGVVLEL